MVELYFIFIGLLLLFIIGLGVLLGSMDVQNIKAEWAKRRCEPTVMFSAFLYKPSNDTRSSADFAADNFTFCMNFLIGEVFTELLTPVLGVFSHQMAAAVTAGDVLNSVRNQLGNAFRSFTHIFDDFFETYKRGTMQLARITQTLRQAMLKISAATISTVFMGLSLMTSLLNTYDFIVKVVIIIMSILVALIVLLFFALIPFMPIIFTTIAVLTGAGFGGAVGGMAGAFCIDPAAEVILVGGARKLLRDVKVGDELGEGCGKVEGILETDAMGQLYSVRGVVMSGSHMVFLGGQPLFAAECGKAIATRISRISTNSLIVLNTSSHKIPLRGEEDTTLLVGDWEEISADDLAAQEVWEKQVWSIINPTKPYRNDLGIEVTTSSVLSPECCVIVKGERGKSSMKSITTVGRGDYVMSLGGIYTKVLGVYRGFGSANNSIRIFAEDGLWRKQKHNICNNEIGYQLVTVSGSFVVLYGKEVISVRDFTEVGYDNIDKTYETTRQSVGKMGV